MLWNRMIIKKNITKIFNPIAYKYHLMNDIMSLGLHRFWKNYLVNNSDIKYGDIILDLACGSGDLTKKLIKRVGHHGHIVAVDVNTFMLKINKFNIIRKNIFYNIDYLHSSAEKLPFNSNVFDCIIISFGLRNFDNKYLALKNIYHILTKSGHIVIMEFSNPNNILFSYFYDIYSFSVIPNVGKIICYNSFSYQYLVESIKMFSYKNNLLKMMIFIGFKQCYYTNLTGGIVTIYTGVKI